MSATPFPFDTHDDAFILDSWLTLDARSGTGRGLRIVFARLADRVAHALCLVNRVSRGVEEVSPLLVSVEGSDADHWPPSPPLQNLTMEKQSGRKVALLLGMAGRSHWSASFNDEPPGRILVEIACRTGASPENLGCEYQLAPSAGPGKSKVLAGQTARGIVLQQGESTVLLESERLKLSRAGAIRISPPQPWTAQTVRWRYEMVLS